MVEQNHTDDVDENSIDYEIGDYIPAKKISEVPEYPSEYECISIDKDSYGNISADFITLDRDGSDAVVAIGKTRQDSLVLLDNGETRPPSTYVQNIGEFTITDVEQHNDVEYGLDGFYDSCPDDMTNEVLDRMSCDYNIGPNWDIEKINKNSIKFYRQDDAAKFTVHFKLN